MVQEKFDYAIEQIGEQNIVLKTKSCNFFGQKSKGLSQIRGNGILILTGDGLFFELFVPSRYWFIPLEKMKDVGTPTRFLQKTNTKPLLQINFTNEEGEDDAMAFYIKELDQWSTQIVYMIDCFKEKGKNKEKYQKGYDKE